jgi:3-hydroxybutyryl-CoA dehydrogenase
MTIQSICVCGAGTMGSGIAQAAAQAGFPALLYELDPGVLDRARQSIQRQLAGLVSKGKISEPDASGIFSRIRFTGTVEDCRADLCIEAIVEKMAAKKELFAALESLNTGDTIFASNTSSLSIRELAAGLRRPSRMLGMHFFNPATLMKLVEIVTTPDTAAESRDAAVEFVKKLGKSPVVCRDAPGFIVNRVARPFYIEALRMAENHVAGFELIDQAMESAGFKMGPFRLMDLIGNDVNYAVSCSVYEQLGKPERLKPSALQQMKVKEGKLGKKTGGGYYDY